MGGSLYKIDTQFSCFLLCSAGGIQHVDVDPVCITCSRLPHPR
jgi:hypothetical protein